MDIRETFSRMAMNDEETVALIAGGHTFGKCHGAASGDEHLGPEPEGAALEEQGLGWRNAFGSGRAGDAITGGPEGAWTTNPVGWDNNYLDNLFGYEWEKTKSPGGAWQWTPVDAAAAGSVPDAHDPDKRHAPMMLTTDLSLKVDPAYEAIARRFRENPGDFADAFARAWYKLTHRDMGPRSRCAGSLVPEEPQLWQDPVPDVDHELIGEEDAAALKRSILDSGLSVARLVSTAWASAASFRGTDRRGGANGARVRLAPQKDWAVNDPAELAAALGKLEEIQAEFNAAQSGAKRVSLADLIVLGGCAAVEEAAAKAGCAVQVPFSPGRTDASDAQTDAESFAVLEPRADGFRNYMAGDLDGAAEEWLVERAYHADAHGARDDGAPGRHARLGRERRRLTSGRLHGAARRADQRFLHKPARHEHRMGGFGRCGGCVCGGATARRAQASGPPLPSTSSSVPTPGSAPSRKPTRATIRKMRSCATSPPRGAR